MESTCEIARYEQGNRQQRSANALSSLPLAGSQDDEQGRQRGRVLALLQLRRSVERQPSAPGGKILEHGAVSALGGAAVTSRSRSGSFPHSLPNDLQVCRAAA